MLATQSVKL